MASRRAVLKGLPGVFMLGGCTSVSSSISQPTHAEEADVLVSNTYGKTTYYSQIRLFSDGFAELTLQESHPNDKIAFTHNKLNVREQAFKKWESPRFSGPKLVHLRPIVKNNGPYPSSNFKFELMSTTEGVTTTSGYPAKITVPDTWLPD